MDTATQQGNSSTTADIKEIVLTVRGAKVEIKDSTDDSTALGAVKLDELRRDTIALFQTWLTKSQISRRFELEVLGRHLFDALFNDDVRTFFVNRLPDRKKNYQLRVQLSFDQEAAELAGWPWEYLYYQPTAGKGFFLSTKVELVLARYIPLNMGRPDELATEEKLRLLLVVSQPDDKDLGSVVTGPVLEAIDLLAAKHAIQIERLDKPTVEKLLDKIGTFHPHALHFMGHGRFNKTEKQGEIALLGYDEASVRWVSDKDFAEYFAQMESVPGLVVLHLCEGGAVDLEANFAGLAPQLMLTGVQAVVAMQHTITNLAAISFSKIFYRELSRGKTVDCAVQRGRWRITTDMSYNNRAFGTPVLYLRSRNAQLIKNPEGTTSGQSRHGLTGSTQLMSIPDTESERLYDEQKSVQQGTPPGPFEEASPPGALDLGGEWGSHHISTEIIANLKNAATKEANRLGLGASTVPDIMSDLNWKTDLGTLRGSLQIRMIKASDPKLEALYKAMCAVLDTPQGRPLP